MEPATISDHTILGRIGVGGMGEVFMAEDLKLRRKVAIKVLSGKFFDDETQRARFLREARNAASLNHPNICTVFQVGEVESDTVISALTPGEPTTIHAGTPFLAMELVEGKTLSQLIVEIGALPVDQLLDLGAQIAEGLAEAHRQGIVHRDLKPGNIMLTPAGRIKILDFGLAKAVNPLVLDDETLEDPLITRELADLTANLTGKGEVIGTPAYMSPEQAMGLEVDRRSDVFSLGMVLSEMASGTNPFSGQVAMRILARIIESDPPALTRPDLPPAFVAVRNRCLEKDPAKRYPDGEGVLQALKAVALSPLISEAVTTQAILPPGSGKRSARIPRSVFLLGSLAAAILVVFAVFQMTDGGGIDVGPLSDEITLAVLPFDHLGEPGKEYVARGITEEITSRLALLRELNVISSSSVSELTTRSPRDAAKALGVDYVLAGSVQWEGDRVQVKCSLSESNGAMPWSSRNFLGSADSIFSLQAEIAEQAAGELDLILEPLRSMPTTDPVAYDFYLQGLDAAGHSLDPTQNVRAIALFVEATTRDSTFALAWARLSMALSWAFWAGFDLSEQHLGTSHGAARTALALQSDLPEGHLALGYYYYRSGRQYEEALAEFQRAREGMPGDSDLLLAIGAVLRRQGDFEGALTNFVRAAKLDPGSGYKAWEAGETLRLLRRFRDAESYYTRAGQLVPDVQYVSNSRAELYLLGLGDPRRARGFLPESLDEDGIWLKTASDIFAGEFETAMNELSLDDFEHPAPYYLFRIWIFDVMKNPAGRGVAAESLLSVLEPGLTEFGDDPNVHSLLGLAHAALGDERLALKRGAEALRLASGDAILEAEMRFQLAWTHWMLGKQDAALLELERLLSIPSLVTRARLRVDPTFQGAWETEQFQAMVAEPSG